MAERNLPFQPPPIDDPDLLGRLPGDLCSLLETENGFVRFGGGLHVRGVSQSPEWHSLRAAWQGERAFHRLHDTVAPDDIPFAEDCVGDQFLLRDGLVIRLLAETGELEPLGLDLSGFLAAAEADPVEFLGLHPLLQIETEDGTLEPGQLIMAYPPFCAEEAAGGVDLRIVPALDLHRFHAELAAALPADGSAVRVEITN